MAFESGQWGPDTFIDSEGATTLIGATVASVGYVCVVDSLGNLTITGPAADAIVFTVTPAAGAAYTVTLPVAPLVSELEDAQELALAAETPAGATAKAAAAVAADLARQNGTYASLDVDGDLAIGGVKVEVGGGGSADGGGAVGDPAAFTPSAPLIVFEGDSQTAANTYPDRVGTLLATTTTRTNVATGGQSLHHMLRDAAAQVDTLFSPKNKANICCIWAGTNDIALALSTGDATYARLVTYCKARRAAGFQVVVLTTLPRSDVGLVAGYETARTTLNTSIRANWATFADALADVAADTRIGDVGDSNDLTYYQADKVHMTTAGYNIVADIVKTALNTIGLT